MQSEDYAASLRACLQVAPTLAPRKVSLDEATGAILAASIIADRDQPPFDRAQMDGYALRHRDLAADRELPVVGRIAAGTTADAPLPDGACMAIATGAPLPANADTVVQHELTDRGDPVRFSAKACEIVAPGHAVHPRGADAHAGAVVLHSGTRLTARHLAIAATVGATAPLVIPVPRVAIITSGDEVVAEESTPQRHQVRNSNARLLRHLVPAFGGQCGRVVHTVDEAEPTTATLDEALRTHDLTITVGGISAGERDRFVDAIEELDLHVIVRRVRLRPGGPLTVAIRRPSSERSGTENDDRGGLLLALPGNPVSALVCAHLFAWPLLRSLAGVDPALPWRGGQLAEPTRSSAERQPFRPCSWTTDASNGIRVRVPRWAGSGDLMHTAATDGIVELPARDGEQAADTAVRVLPWAG